MDKLISSHFTCIILEYILYQKDMTSPMHSSQAASAGQRDISGNEENEEQSFTIISGNRSGACVFIYLEQTQ